MAETKGVTVNVELNTDKLQMKLRAIAKHAEALANELNEIDNLVECPHCGSHNTGRYCHEYTVAYCNECNADITRDELPTRPEVSD